MTRGHLLPESRLILSPHSPPKQPSLSPVCISIPSWSPAHPKTATTKLLFLSPPPSSASAWFLSLRCLRNLPRSTPRPRLLSCLGCSPLPHSHLVVKASGSSLLCPTPNLSAYRHLLMMPCPPPLSSLAGTYPGFLLSNLSLLPLPQTICRALGTKAIFPMNFSLLMSLFS